ncbi:MAG: hypothetical protein ACREMD_02340 [Gemmatimonadota bacterium]
MVGGTLGGTIGFFGGLFLGLAIGSNTNEDAGVFNGAVAAVVGESLLLPAGVHVANDTRGSYPIAALVSSGIAAGVVASILLVEDRTDADGSLALIALGAVPVIQLATSIAIERRTAKAKGGNPDRR